MAGHNHGTSLGRDEPKEARDLFMIDRCDSPVRLIGKKAERLPDEYRCELCTPALAAGQRMHTPIETLPHIGQLRGFVNASPAIDIVKEVQLLPDAELRGQQVVIREVEHAPSRQVGQAWSQHGFSEQVHHTRVGLHPARRNLHQGRLAGAISAKDHAHRSRHRAQRSG